MTDTGFVAEIFRSIQGEGPYVGVLQVFVRMSGCSLSCSYCDSAFARGITPQCTVRDPNQSTTIDNPVHTDVLLDVVRSFLERSPGVHSLSLTGGEPLEQSEFVIRFLERFIQHGVAVYLETSGLIESAARDVVELVDIVSLDIKLPSLCEGGDFFSTYQRVLPVYGRKELFCKVVIASGFDEGEFIDAVNLVSEFDNEIPFVIQPATQPGGHVSMTGIQLIECYETAAGKLTNVRLIPQMHHLLELP